jgi:hypothetical protein
MLRLVSGVAVGKSETETIKADIKEKCNLNKSATAEIMLFIL